MTNSDALAGVVARVTWLADRLYGLPGEKQLLKLTPQGAERYACYLRTLLAALDAAERDTERLNALQAWMSRGDDKGVEMWRIGSCWGVELTEYDGVTNVHAVREHDFRRAIDAVREHDFRRAIDAARTPQPETPE